MALSSEHQHSFLWWMAVDSDRSRPSKHYTPPRLSTKERVGISLSALVVFSLLTFFCFIAEFGVNLLLIFKDLLYLTYILILLTFLVVFFIYHIYFLYSVHFIRFFNIFICKFVFKFLLNFAHFLSTCLFSFTFFVNFCNL